MALVDGFFTVDTLTPTVQAFGQAFPRALTATAKVAAVKVAPKIRVLAQAPRAVVYPIRWRSVKQRRAFFASNGFGKGIPYQRTGTAAASWEIEVTQVDNATLVAISNPVDYSQFVYGRVGDTAYQQPFHRITGYASADDIVTVGRDLMVEEITAQLAPAIGRLLEVRS